MKISEYISEAYKAREILYYLIWKNLLIKYKQTFLGLIWSILKPLIATAILVLVFNRFIGLESGAIPYPLLVISGFLLWNLFSNSLSAGYVSLVSEQVLVNKVYIPRLLIPLSSVLSNLSEALITFCLIIIFSYYFDANISLNIIFAPLMIILVVLLSFSLSMFFSIIYARYRDLSYIIPFFLQLGFYLSPIAYSKESVESEYSFYYYFNPFVAIIEFFRWCIFEVNEGFDFSLLIYPLSLTFLIFVISLKFFTIRQKNIGDVI